MCRLTRTYSGTTMSVVAMSFLLYSTTAMSPLVSGFAHTSCPPTGVTPTTRAAQKNGSAQGVIVWFPLRSPPKGKKETTTSPKNKTKHEVRLEHKRPGHQSRKEEEEEEVKLQHTGSGAVHAGRAGVGGWPAPTPYMVVLSMMLTAWNPIRSWLTAITSLSSKIFLAHGSTVRRSFDMSNGEENTAHIAIMVSDSTGLRPLHSPEHQPCRGDQRCSQHSPGHHTRGHHMRVGTGHHTRCITVRHHTTSHEETERVGGHRHTGGYMPITGPREPHDDRNYNL